MGNKADKDSIQAILSKVVSTDKTTEYRASEHSQSKLEKLITINILVEKR